VHVQLFIQRFEHSICLLKCEEIFFIVPCFPDMKVLLPTGNPTDISETYKINKISYLTKRRKMIVISRFFEN
jgi:hypothetical protein